MMVKTIPGAVLALVLAGVCGAEIFDPGGMNLLKVRPLAERVQVPPDVAVAVWPTGIIDSGRTHYLNRGSPTLVMVAIANPKTRAIASSRVVCDLPEGVEIVAVNTNLLWNTKKSERIRRDGKPYARHRIEVRPSRDTIPKGKLMNCWYARYQPPSLWLTTDLPAGARPGRLYVRLAYREGDAEAESPESWVDIAVLPPLKADTPKIVRTGVMGRAPCAITPYENDDYKDQARLIGTYLRQMGFNLQMCEIHPSLSPPGLTRWTEGRNVNQIDNKGFRHNEREPVGVGNGFFIHLEPEKRGAIPAEVQRLDGGGQRQTGGMMAPWAIYRRHPWIQQHVLDVIARSVERGDYEVLWANWEPRMSEQDRDYSDGSKREFVKWSKLPEDEVERLWLDELIRKYPKNWWHFRNWELGQVVRIYSDVVREAGARTGRDTRFMICMPQDMMMIDDNVEPYAWQGLRWGDMPIIMQTWSYHNTPRSDRRFPKIDKMAHYLVRRSGWVRRYVDQQLGPDRQVQLGCVYGWEQTGGRAGFFVPEDLALRHLAIAMAGLDVTINYAEWTVWDGRYATEMARVNTRIARWERFTLMGKTQSKHVLVPASPYPQQISEDATPSDQLMDGGWPGGGYLQSYEYEQDDKRLIAVINNWHFGDCFLKLKADDLDEGGKYVLWEPEEGRAYANAKGDVALSAGDLADGLLVHVGSTRCGAFLIERFDRTRAYGRIVQPREVRDAMLRRRDALEAGVSRSAEYQ